MVDHRSRPSKRRGRRLDVAVYRYAWGNNPKRATMKGRLCVIEARGSMNSVLIRFLDNGEKCVTSRRALRRGSV